MDNTINKTDNVPRFAREIISRPGKEAYEFMRTHNAEIYAHYQTKNLYYVVIRRKIYRVVFEGMPSAMVRADFFKKWLKKLLQD